MAVIPDTLKATQADYELKVDSREAIEATNPENASATAIDTARLQAALDRAFNRLCAADAIACFPGKVLIRKQLKELQLDITRWELDTLKQREDIKQAYDQAMELLAYSRSTELCCSCDLSVDEDIAEELGLDVPNRISFTAQKRRWKRGTTAIDTFRRGRYTNDR